jgi:hypothetical protein
MLVKLEKLGNLNSLAREAVKEVSLAKNKDREKNNNTLMELKFKPKLLSVDRD